MKVQEIFTPNDTPTVTYVDRAEHKLEQTLKDHYLTPNVVVSISGPSKSGKTVLIKKVIPEDFLITVIGAGISSADNLWERALNWMGAPSERSISSSTQAAVNGAAEAGGKVDIPFVAKGESKGSIGGSKSWGSEKTESFRQGGINQVIKEIAGSEFVIFIDDFHYIKAELRDEIGKQIKVAAENGVKIFTASVPHRADDVVRSNPELRGRVAAVDLSYWSPNELVQIARKGFAELNVVLDEATEQKFAAEAFGSPQLMQSICLNYCYATSLREKQKEPQKVVVPLPQIEETLLRTSSFTDFSKMITALHTGARSRGTERKLHDFKDGSKGDVYRAILLAMKADPPELSFSYDKIVTRVRNECIGEPPAGSSITSALEQMNGIAEEIQPGSSPLAWDGDTLDIADPYLLFFIRCSEKISSLSSK